MSVRVGTGTNHMIHKTKSEKGEHSPLLLVPQWRRSPLHPAAPASRLSFVPEEEGKYHQAIHSVVVYNYSSQWYHCVLDRLFHEKAKWQDLNCLQAVSDKMLSFKFLHSNANHTHTSINNCIHVVYAPSYLVSRLHTMQRVSLECDTGNTIFRWLTGPKHSICLLFHLQVIGTNQLLNWLLWWWMMDGCLRIASIPCPLCS